MFSPPLKTKLAILEKAAAQIGAPFWGWLLYRLGLVMLVFTVLRLLFYAFNQSYFPDLPLQRLIIMLWGGLRFDLLAVLYTNTLFLLLFLIPTPFRYRVGYQRTAQWIFLFTNTIIIAANCIDLVYFRFTLRRTSVTFFREFQHDAANVGLLGRIVLDYWYLIPLCALLVYFLAKCYGGYIRRPERLAKGWLYYPSGLLIMAIGAGLFVAGVRGGFSPSIRPITLNNAGEYVEKPLEMAIVLNTPFSIYKTLEIQSLTKANYFATDAEAQAVFSPVHRAKPAGAFRPLNVVVLIVESFGKEYIGSLNADLENGQYKGYAPFMDSLLKESRTFRYTFANGKKSIDAMPSILAGIPSLVEPYITTPYSGNEINGLAGLLKTKGYQTAFFHGAPERSMGFKAFSRLAGYERYFALEDYGNDADYDGRWGIWDEEFLQFFANEMDKMRQPFHTALFTVSSHHPYALPPRYEGKFPKGHLPIHRCIGYTDMALRRFFERAARSSWFQNTLFVLTADHTNQAYFERYKNAVGVFSVPLLFYRPNGELRGLEEKLAQQNDVMPTVLNYLNFDQDFLSFGSDALAPNTVPFVVNYPGMYQILLGDHVLQFDGNQTVALYNFKTDPLLTDNLKGSLPEIQTRLETKIKAYIQEYNRRLIDDDLTAKPKKNVRQ